MNFEKQQGEKGESNEIFKMIETHLRYLMLWQTLEKIKNEAESNHTINTHGDSASTCIYLGGILEIKLDLDFFAKP